MDISNEIIISILGAILLLSIGYLIFRLTKAEKKRKESDDNFKQLESKINQLQLQTLESKLNPHLFKNILNSIQSHAYQT